MTLRSCLASAAAALALAGCDFDDGTHGLRATCAEPSGSALDCERPAIETAEDACWKMVACGAIPIDESGSFDWPRCVSYIRGLESFRRDFSLACVEHAPCHELVFSGSPDSPSRNPENFPACLQHGDQ